MIQQSDTVIFQEMSELQPKISEAQCCVQKAALAGETSLVINTLLGG